ncbi:MAG: phosphoglucosamine mutase [Alcanivorax sp.]|uniref:phosphoglucosamine mutase n=1 Tax=unclassified Ketobacter TaxID=2639109 RepID=UPI000F211A62|nr:MULTISPECIES: phosphoglucosamine mutase [unclassified Ketobacter]MCK5793047.1 phosphoglucosamine mutase [Ketobacter sp.]RLT87981.1 MAG: phosphoglucosamine mutase [Ketobacter sp. GenoA1]RLT95240.1 MAG: phosphoglucosamine mutase [Ketobacter sp.]TNC88089.1 MAG: phosphoglucosamine mutase [Alcanivorax sp.]
MSKQYFGTDGIRGKVGEGAITPEFMLKLGWAAGKVFAQGEGRQRILIGKDTRISGYMFESALEAGLSASGVDVMLLGPMPTPAIAYLTRTYRAAAGIVISASHNPYYDNGIKFFCTEGKKLPDEVELAIESQLGRKMDTVPSDRIGKTKKLEDARGRYIEFCKSTFPRHLSLHGLRIVVDCANGATYAPGPAVFEELGAEIVPIGVKPDGLNINHNCGSTHPQALQEKVLELRADMGIAFDGDGDRVLMVDAEGELVDGDELLFIIASGRQLDRSLQGGVVGTLMSNYGLELALQSLGVDFVRAKVGDRYVMELLKQNDWQLGGESSGHIVCLDKTTTGDGIVSALQVLAAMVAQGKALAELRSGMTKLPQTMINVRLPEKQEVVSIPQVQDAVKTVESQLSGRGRVLLRPSGTEPLIRVMVEGDDADEVAGLCRQIADAVEEVIGA